MRIALAQINPVVGDLEGNTALILRSAEAAVAQGADLLVVPEMALTGYPPEDLLLRASFLKDNIAALKALAKRLPVTAVIGFVDIKNADRFNAAAWIQDRKIAAVYHKRLLPNYGVFDEERYFTPGTIPLIRTLKGQRVAVTICEDIWIPGPHWTAIKRGKPDFVVNLSASPFHTEKLRNRHRTFRSFVNTVGTPLAYCNAVGGQDELVFDGASFVLNDRGTLAAQAPMFREGVYTFDVDERGKISPLWEKPAALDGVDQVLDALVLGLRDYVRKNRFSKVVIGISGGIDSALVAALAVQALGADNVTGVTMPSRFNSKETISDAGKLAANLGIRFMEIPIEATHTSFLKALAPAFTGTKPNEAEENIQARVRGTLLMALSNKFGWLVLTTGNKSEVSTGYCTLYGDTAGGFAVLKDVLKTSVYAISRRINERAGRDVIPESTITRPPTAELRADQKDEDSLGAYSELDPVIVAYVEENRSLRDLIAKTPGKAAYFEKVLGLIDRSEYKRRQAPPGIKITPRAFGRDHRMPLTNRYRPA